MVNTKEDVLKIVREEDVKFIRLWFTDILGQVKSFAITNNELEKALEDGMGFDGLRLQAISPLKKAT